jgi:DNA-binding transcriptional LysR family regulator
MQIEFLKVFCDLIEARSFSKAAFRNSISQSAVSQQVRALEMHFGRKLIERGRRIIAPTEAGLKLYQGCREILEQYEALLEEMAELKGGVGGTLRVATIHSVGLHELPPLLKKFLQAYPDVNLKIEYSRMNKVYEDVLSGAADLGIVAYPAPRPHIEIVPMRGDKLALICNPKHELAHRKRIALSDLQGERFISFEPDIPTRKAIDQILARHGVSVRHVKQFDNVEIIKRSVEAGQGISIVPRASVEMEVRAGTLRAIDFTRRLERSIGIIYQKGKNLNAAARKFIELLASQNPRGRRSTR